MEYGQLLILWLLVMFELTETSEFVIVLTRLFGLIVLTRGEKYV
jgi:hypothetical protein